MDIGLLLEWKEGNEPQPGWEEVFPESRTLKAMWVQCESLRVHVTMQLVVTKNYVLLVLEEVHGGARAPTVEQTKLWQKYINDSTGYIVEKMCVEKWCLKCVSRQEFNSTTKRKYSVWCGIIIWEDHYNVTS